MESKTAKKTTTKNVAPTTVSKKSTNKVVESPPVSVPTPVVEAVVKKSTKKVIAPPSEAPSVASTNVASSVAVSNTLTETVPEVESHERLETLANEMIKMAKQFLEASRQARKEHARVVKKSEQGGKRRHRKADGESSHSNSVFLQPCKVSPALATFCGITDTTEAMMSRTDATRAINAYIKTNDLQNPENRREIRPDATLTKLFSLGAEDKEKLTYFNLQRFIKPHFIKDL